MINKIAVILITLGVLLLSLSCMTIPPQDQYNKNDWQYKINTPANGGYLTTYLANTYKVNADGTLTLSDCAKVLLLSPAPILEPVQIQKFKGNVVISGNCFMVEPNE